MASTLRRAPHTALRFPPALGIFPTLRRYPALRPRRVKEVPIGGPTDPEFMELFSSLDNDVDSFSSQSRTAQSLLNKVPVAICLRQLYHDMGVLAFNGGTASQISRMGDILQAVGEMGGLSAAVVGVELEGRPERGRIEFREADVFESIDKVHAGVLKPETIIAKAGEVFKEIIRQRSENLGIDFSQIQLRESLISVRGVPFARGITTHTLKGTHPLPVDSFSTVLHGANGRNLTCEMRLYSAGGRSEFCGGVRIDYVLHRINTEERTMKPLIPANEFPILRGAFAKTIDQMSSQRYNVLVNLWKLEAELLGEKTKEMEEMEDMKFKMSEEMGDREDRMRNRWRKEKRKEERGYNRRGHKDVGQEETHNLLGQSKYWKKENKLETQLIGQETMENLEERSAQKNKTGNEGDQDKEGPAVLEEKGSEVERKE